MASSSRRSNQKLSKGEGEAVAAPVPAAEGAAPVEQPAPTASPAKEEAKTPLRPGQCRAYMRRALAEEFDGIVKGFIEGAKSGSCPHVKLATEFLESRPRAKRPKSGRRTIERWIDEVERGV